MFEAVWCNKCIQVTNRVKYGIVQGFNFSHIRNELFGNVEYKPPRAAAGKFSRSKEKMDIGSKPAAWDSAWNRIGSTDMAIVRDQQSQDMFSYTQIPMKFENPSKCRNALGLVGGAEVSNISGNMVDLESELRGITRSQSKCISRQYQPACPLGGTDCPETSAPIHLVDKSTGMNYTIDTTLNALPTCQMNTYPGVPAPQNLKTSTCYTNRF